MSHCSVVQNICRGLKYTICGFCVMQVRTIHCHWSLLKYKQTSVSTGSHNSCLDLTLYWWFTLDIPLTYTHTNTHTRRALYTHILHEKVHVILERSDVGSAFVSSRGPHRPDAFSRKRRDCRLRRDGWAGRSVRGVWGEGGKGKEGEEGTEGRRERREGGREGGGCLNTQPLWVDGQWHPKHFLPRTPSKGTCC